MSERQWLKNRWDERREEKMLIHSEVSLKRPVIKPFMMMQWNDGETKQHLAGWRIGLWSRIWYNLSLVYWSLFMLKGPLFSLSFLLSLIPHLCPGSSFSVKRLFSSLSPPQTFASRCVWCRCLIHRRRRSRRSATATEKNRVFLSVKKKRRQQKKKEQHHESPNCRFMSKGRREGKRERERTCNHVLH